MEALNRAMGALFSSCSKPNHIAMRVHGFRRSPVHLYYLSMNLMEAAIPVNYVSMPSTSIILMIHFPLEHQNTDVYAWKEYDNAHVFRRKSGIFQFMNYHKRGRSGLQSFSFRRKLRAKLHFSHGDSPFSRYYHGFSPSFHPPPRIHYQRCIYKQIFIIKPVMIRSQHHTVINGHGL